jgi:putative membrane protein
MAIAITGTSSFAQQTSVSTSAGAASMVGKESKAEFDSQNQKGAAAVGAVKVTPAKLSGADQKLLLAVAKGGMMQLEVSKVAAQKATNPEVRQLAQAEVTEQTSLAAKLKKIASAKCVFRRG